MPELARRTLAEFRTMRVLELQGVDLAAGYEVLNPDGSTTHHDYVVLEIRPGGSVVVELPTTLELAPPAEIPDPCGCPTADEQLEWADDPAAHGPWCPPWCALGHPPA